VAFSRHRTLPLDGTAIAAVHNDLVRAADTDHVTAFTLLDQSSVFDTVEHSIMLTVLQLRFGLDGQALEWFRSHLADRSQAVVSDVAGRLQRTAGLSPRTSVRSSSSAPSRTSLLSLIATVSVIISSPTISRRTLTLPSVMSTMCMVAGTTALPISSAGVPLDACN